MRRVLEKSTFVAVTTSVILITSCSSSDQPGDQVQVAARSAQKELVAPKNTKSLPARHLVQKLADAGLEARELGPAEISLDDSSRFPAEPRSSIVLRVSDGKGNSSPMTFVEFGSWKDAAKLDAKPVNGFAVRNWFVLGTTSTYFVDLVTNALSG